MIDYVELYLMGFGTIDNNFYEDAAKYDNEEFYVLEKNIKNLTEAYYDIFQPYMIREDDLYKYLKILKVKIPVNEIVEYFIESSRYTDDSARIKKLEVLENLTDSYLQNIKVFD